jgi:predicted RNase H-like HicB family nuclease
MSEIIFIVENSDEGGYTAKCLGHSIYTEGETLDELKENVKDAIKCHFDLN